MKWSAFVSGLGGLAVVLGSFSSTLAAKPEGERFVQYGKMHEVIGQQQHQGRVKFAELVKQPHFYGVGALESLGGEATILDGKVTLTQVKSDGKLQTLKLTPRTQAALLVGGYVTDWSKHPLSQAVSSDDLNSLIEQDARQAGLDVKAPFVFVIDGACPIRARMRKEALPADKRPYEADLPKVSGKLVGVFAKDAAGNITHPGTSVHMHLLFQDTKSGEMRTGHVEKLTVAPGATLLLPEK